MIKKLHPKTKKKIKTTVFWSGITSALLIFIQNIALTFGYDIPTLLLAHIFTSVNSLLGFLALLGVLIDSKEVPSFQAMRLKIKK